MPSFDPSRFAFAALMESTERTALSPHRNHFNSYSFTCVVEDRQLFPFYTEVRLKPVCTYVSLANLWRATGLELIVNMDQRWPKLRFTRKFWEFYLSLICRGKELQFEFQVIKT